MRLLFRGGCLEISRLDSGGIHPFKDTPRATVLAACIHPLQHHQQGLAGVRVKHLLQFADTLADLGGLVPDIVLILAVMEIRVEIFEANGRENFYGLAHNGSQDNRKASNFKLQTPMKLQAPNLKHDRREAWSVCSETDNWSFSKVWSLSFEVSAASWV